MIHQLRILHHCSAEFARALGSAAPYIHQCSSLVTDVGAEKSWKMVAEPRCSSSLVEVEAALSPQKKTDKNIWGFLKSEYP